MAFAFVPTGFLALAFAAARKGAAVIVPVATGLAGAIRNRLAVKRLADLDDRALKDIGLVRSDVAGALAQPVHVDPSAVLSLRRGERGRLGASVLTSTPAAPRAGQLPRPGHLPRTA